MDRATVLTRHLQPENAAGQAAPANPPVVHLSGGDVDSPQQPVVLHETHSNGLLSIVLNRPQALNALSGEMIASISALFKQQIADPKGRAIVISSSGNAFCAGGDIRYLAQLVKNKDTAAFANYLTLEYQCDRLAYVCPLPYVALINGVWMGGGVGISYGAKWKVVTEKAMFAMPETGIGFLPDVSGSYFLPRLQGSVGMYVGLLGARLKAADCIHTGIATHYVHSSKLSELKAALQSAATLNSASVGQIIQKFSSTPPEPAALKEIEPAVNRCFSADSVEEIIARLQKEQTPWAAEMLRIFATRSPTALKVTHAALRRGAKLSLEDALNMELQVCVHFCQHADFPEGVRAVIIDKDNKPRWSPPTLEQISKVDVERFFEPIVPAIVFPPARKR